MPEMASSPLQARRVRIAWAFLAPALGVLALVAGWPLAGTLTLAFTDARLGVDEAAAWVGAANFVLVLTDPEWWTAVANTLIFAAVSVGLELMLGLGLALLLDRHFRGRGGLRAAVLIPWAVPTVVSAQLGRWVFNDVYGVVNDLLLRMGLIGAPIAWLAHEAAAMAAIIAVDVWKSTPFMALLLLAGLQTIPAQLYEAARVDGVGPWRTFLHVTLPLLRPAIAVALIFRTLDALRVFDLVYVMGSNAQATATVSVYARRQLVDFADVGYGSAASVLVVALIGAICVALVIALRPAERVR
jgi:trehalose/maltose transport system permease protein